MGPSPTKILRMDEGLLRGLRSLLSMHVAKTELGDTLQGRPLAVLVIQEFVVTQLCTENRKKSQSLVPFWYQLPSGSY